MISRNSKGQFTGNVTFAEMECHECGTPFTPKSYSAKYCTNKCMYSARKKRRTESISYQKSLQNSVYKRKYGITLDEYNTMLKQQNKRCAICSIHSDDLNIKLCVDHCHDTGTVRGLLCSMCNRAIGFLSDDAYLLEKAARYLREYSDD